MKIRKYIQNLKFILPVLLLFLGSRTVGQETHCAGSVHTYRVDINENGGNGTTNSVYSWQVLPADDFQGTITPITSSGNQIEIDWGSTPGGNYTVIVTENNNGCISTQQIDVIIRELNLDAVEDMYICPDGGNVTFNAGFGFDSYAWYDEGGNLIGSTREITVDQAGDYTLEVTSDGCTASKTVEAIPIDFPIFAVNTDAYNTIVVETLGGNIENLEYQLEDMQGNIIKSWQTGSVFYHIDEGIYIVRIRSWDASCYTYITAVTANLPNTITPNGDGYNDYWDLSRLSEYAPDARVEVYDRYGKFIKRITKEDNFRWDGTYLGRPLPSASYVYILYIGGEKITGYLMIRNY